MIYEYTADMLSTEKERDLMRHIESCSSCRNELERIRAVMGAASEIEDVPVPDELISALDTRLEQTGREIRNSRRQGYGNITGTVLSLAAAAALAIGMYSGGVFDKTTPEHGSDNVRKSISLFAVFRSVFFPLVVTFAVYKIVYAHGKQFA